MTSESGNCCEKGKDPKTCSPEQIKECHGEVAKHECEEKEEQGEE